MKRREKGRAGEEAAARFFKDKGWRILERNYQNRYGEVDIIAKDGETLVFIEVKNWDYFAYSDLEYALDEKKRRNIIQVARSFIDLLGAGEDIPVRFDVFFCGVGGDCAYIESAFTETGGL